MPDNNENEALRGEQNRQAIPSIRGYFYQIWHSLHAWLELRDDERLYLEGAEDFDVALPDAATAVQVKDTAANVTLRSPDVKEAIQNYWTTRTNNPRRTIKFRFLTTSGIGVEQGQPFGARVAGLDLWQQCARDRQLVDQLRGFLVDHGGFTGDLLAHLRTADGATLFATLIQPITWETNAPAADAVEQAIERHLILHGERQGIGPEAATKVADRLLKEVVATIVRSDANDRYLDRAAFLKIFEDQTTVRVPLQQLAVMQAAFTAILQGGFPALPGAQALQPFPVVQTSVPPLPTQCLDRTALVTESLGKLQRLGSLILTGSSGLGKSTLAKLVCVRSPGNWLWLDLSGRHANEVTAALHELAQRSQHDRDIANIALDDLDVSPAELRKYERYLAGLFYTTRERSGNVIVTVRGEVTTSTLNRLGLALAVLHPVPRFTVADITQFAFRLGCSDPALAKSWAEIIELHTHGHPDLVHAHLSHTARQGWPPPQPEDWLVIPADVAEARRAARRLLNKQSEAQERDLLYRLSLVGRPFRRAHAIKIAEIPPSADFPGDIFDGLVGPWIEPAGADYYRVSALLEGAAAEVWSPEQRKTLHAGIARAVFTCQPLSTLDASTVTMHALQGDAEDVMLWAAVSLLQVSAESWPVVAASLGWLTFVRPTNGSGLLFAADLQTSLWSRLLQFRVAATVRPEAGESIALAWKAELDAAKPDDMLVLYRYLYALTVSIFYQVPSPPRFLLEQLSELAALEPMLRSQFGAESVMQLDEPNLQGDLLPHLFCFVAARCQSFGFLDELIDALDAIEKPLRDRLLSAISIHTQEVGPFLTSKPWTEESNRPHPDWPAGIAVLEKLFERALAWGVPELALEAARMVTIIRDETLHDFTGASAGLDQCRSRFDRSHPSLEDARATALFNHKDYAEALAIWEEILPSWLDEAGDTAVRLMFAHRAAGMAAGFLGKWQKAVRFFTEGRRLALISEETAMATGFLADAAFAFWRQGDYLRFLKDFETTLDEIEQLPDMRTDLRTLYLHKTSGQILLWLNARYTSVTGVVVMEPTPGMCSNPEPDPKVRDFVETFLDGSWLHLVSLELYLTRERTLYHHLSGRLRASTLPWVQYQFAALELSYAFRDREFAELPSDVARLMAASQFFFKHLASGRKAWEVPATTATISADAPIVDLGSEIFLAAMVSSTAGTDPFDASLTTQWKDNARGLPYEATVTKMADEFSQVLAADHRTAVGALKDANASADRRSIAAVHVTQDPSVSPDDLFVAHCFLVLALSNSSKMHDVSESLAQLLSKQWLQQVRLRFGLLFPRLTVPAIEAACREQLPGARKAAKIVLAAGEAVRVRLPASIRSEFQRLAEGPGGDTAQTRT